MTSVSDWLDGAPNEAPDRTCASHGPTRRIRMEVQLPLGVTCTGPGGGVGEGVRCQGHQRDVPQDACSQYSTEGRNQRTPIHCATLEPSISSFCFKTTEGHLRGHTSYQERANLAAPTSEKSTGPRLRVQPTAIHLQPPVLNCATTCHRPAVCPDPEPGVQEAGNDPTNRSRIT